MAVPETYFYVLVSTDNKGVVAGDNYDVHVYHQEPNGRDNAQWRFVPTGDGKSYYIYDRLHGKAWAAGDNQDGHVYHQDPAGRDNAKWIPTLVAEPGWYQFVDKKWSKAIAAGRGDDSTIYHQEARQQSNSLWKLDVALDGDKGPAFLPKEVVVTKVTPSDPAMLDNAPLAVIDQTVNNPSDSPQTITITHSVTDQTVQEWTFEESLSLSVTTKISAEFGVPGDKVDVGVESTIGTTESDGHKTSRSVTSLITWTIPVTVPAKSNMKVTAELRKQRQEIPFKADVTTTMQDGSSTKKTIKGTWKTTKFVQGAVNFAKLPPNQV